jgi:hypothetical protein
MPTHDSPVVELKPDPSEAADRAAELTVRYGEPIPIRDVMRRLGYRRPDSVYALLSSGQMVGHRMSPRGGARPRWKVYPADVDAYLARTRTAGPPAALPVTTPAEVSTKASRRPGGRFIDRSRRIV